MSKATYPLIKQSQKSVLIPFFEANPYQQVKRAFDLLLTIPLILLLSPLLIATTLAIRMESKGNPIFMQTRIGKDGIPFTIYKFRSMYENSKSVEEMIRTHKPDREGICAKIYSDPRVTPLGKIIRKLSIDELPQLFNVLQGEMSLIGPRPALESEVNQYTLLERQRLKALPGITGLWQISGRADLSFDEQVELDIDYIKNISFLLDVKILLLTLPAVISGKGAY